jgi:hypothetical protein
MARFVDLHKALPPFFIADGTYGVGRHGVKILSAEIARKHYAHQCNQVVGRLGWPDLANPPPGVRVVGPLFASRNR